MRRLLKQLSSGFSLALLLSASSFLAPVATTQAADWPTAAPHEAGFAPDLADQLDAALDEEGFSGVHSVVLVRHGKLVYERYLSGDDERHGLPKQNVVFSPESLHDVRSITKSVISLLYGIAMAEKDVPQPQTRLFAALPAFIDYGRHPLRHAITIDDVLSMTMGLEWDEMNVPYSDPANSEIAMYRAPSSMQYVLGRPMTSPPGRMWTYSGGATTVLAELIGQGTGEELMDYARERLFQPLGIETFEWATDYYGQPRVASGLRLRPRDTAKLGQLVLQFGRWNRQQIVPDEWIAASTRVHAQAIEGCGYGYHWWVCKTNGGMKIIEASGWGGQQLLVAREAGIVLVVNCGLYGDPNAWRRAYDLLEGIVLPALQEQSAMAAL